MTIAVDVPSKELAQLGEVHDLFLMARISDEHGHTIEQGWLGNKIERSMPKKASLQFRLPFLVVPGDYSLAVVLFDRTTRRYNVHTDTLHPKPIKNDPLPHAFSSLPRAQMLPPAKGIEALRNARIQSRLALPVQSSRPVHFEVLLILGPLEQRSLKTGSSYSGFGFAVSALHVFSQLRPKDFSIHLTVVDPLRHQVIFEQNDGKELDWSGLRKAIESLNPGVITAQALEVQNQNAAYLRKLFVERLRERPALAAGGQPLKALLLIGSPMFFPKGTERESLQPEHIRDLLFYQFRFFGYDIFQFNRRGFRFPAERLISYDHFLSDDLDKVLKPANPVQFNILTPMHFREALAHLIAAIEKRSQDAATARGAASPL